MALPHKIVKMTLGGRMYNDSEIWSIGLTIGNPDLDAEWELFANDDSLTDELVNHCRTWFTSRDAGISPVSRLEWVKFSLVNEDGKYAAGTTDYLLNKIVDIQSVPGGLYSINNYPTGIAPQLSVAITLDTMVKRGLAKTGRVYPPTTGQPNGDGVDDNPAGKAKAFAQLISSINGTLAGEGNYPYDSVVVASGVREGAIARVQFVRVGRVIDTQRRRRSALAENYTPADVLVYGEEFDEYELAA